MADVARRAQVSISTVSYALSGARPVSADTRRKIERAMEDLGFEPNILARGLARARSNIIALVYPEGTRGIDLTGIDVLSAASRRARQRGYHALLWTNDADVLEAAPRLSPQGLVAGVLMLEVRTDDERVAALAEFGVPFAMIGRPGDPIDIPSVDTDVPQMASQALRYLLDLGHDVVGYLGVAPSEGEPVSNFTRWTAAEFDEAAGRVGVKSYQLMTDATPAAGAEALRSFRVAHPDLTAIITLNEPATAGVLAAAGRQGCRVPEDLSVVALMSSARAAEMANPPLTTVGVSHRALGERGADLLIDLLEDSTTKPTQVLLPTEVHVRGSSGPRRRV
jgi:DNA-binding LacI/PurR family transcriptional regulator